MKPVSPVIKNENFHETKIAEHQDEYQTLPSIVCADGTVISRWELSDEDLDRINESRSVFLLVSTFNKPLQPVLLSTEPPEIETVSEALSKGAGGGAKRFG